MLAQSVSLRAPSPCHYIGHSGIESWPDLKTARGRRGAGGYGRRPPGVQDVTPESAITEPGQTLARAVWV